MLRNKKIVVVIPAYNVGRQIAAAVNGLPEFVDHIVVADDCSLDDTVVVVGQISDERVILLRNERNQGVGGATIAAFRKGLELSGDVFVKYDGDGQMDPDRMQELITPVLDGYDYAKGNRFLQTSELSKMPKTRLLGSFCLTFLTKLASGYWTVFDPQNGYVAISRGVLESLPLESLSKRYFFENDMLVNLNILDASVKDVDIPSRYGDEESSMRISRILVVFPILLASRFVTRVYFKHILREFSPIGMFYALGSILLLLGALFGAYAWTRSILTGVVATTGTVMISVLPIVLGFQLFLQAMVTEVGACNVPSNLAKRQNRRE